MSPFDLPGPLFLVFYLFIGGIALIVVAMLHNFAESRDSTKVNLSDPYLIAYLRGGRKQALQVATVSLIDRGLLKVSGSTISTISNAANSVRAPLAGGAASETLPDTQTGEFSVLRALV